MHPESLLVGFVLGILVAIAVYSARGRRPSNINKPARVPIGRYLGGFPLATTPVDYVDCLIDSSAFVFVSKHNKEFGRIPRTAVVDLFCEEKPLLLPRLTATKNITFPNLGVGKKRSLSGYCLVVDWQIGDTRNNAIFEFGGVAARVNAHGVETILKSNCKASVPPLRFDERNCPFCREVVKKEALVCKHCHGRITDPRPVRVTLPA
ncbi:MAG: hypothetical protein IPH59_06205 [bacterium]|nr:hypothetical protein [bacterium]